MENTVLDTWKYCGMVHVEYILQASTQSLAGENTEFRSVQSKSKFSINWLLQLKGWSAYTNWANACHNVLSCRGCTKTKPRPSPSQCLSMAHSKKLEGLWIVETIFLRSLFGRSTPLVRRKRSDYFWIKMERIKCVLFCVLQTRTFKQQLSHTV